jgi:hypothetical protein
MPRSQPRNVGGRSRGASMLSGCSMAVGQEHVGARPGQSGASEFAILKSVLQFAYSRGLSEAYAPSEAWPCHAWWRPPARTRLLETRAAVARVHWRVASGWLRRASCSHRWLMLSHGHREYPASYPLKQQDLRSRICAVQSHLPLG